MSDRFTPTFLCFCSFSGLADRITTSAHQAVSLSICTVRQKSSGIGNPHNPSFPCACISTVFGAGWCIDAPTSWCADTYLLHVYRTCMQVCRSGQPNQETVRKSNSSHARRLDGQFSGRREYQWRWSEL